MSDVGDEIEIRRFEPRDEAGVLDLLADSLGWQVDERHAALFRWKHLENPAGPSPAWVGVAGDGVVGFRAFLRCPLDGPRGGLSGARAVDTATRTAHRGRGVFRALTTTALGQLEGLGVELVFNTPNAASAPGYRSMGWSPVGRLPAAVRPRSAAGMARMLRARAPAQLWSVASGKGEEAPDVLDDPALSTLVDSLAPSPGLCTRRSVPYLRWRYGHRPLAYRAVLRRRLVEEGVALFRLRRRGWATEAVVCDLLVPGGDRGAEAELLRALRRAVGTAADYTLVMPQPGRPAAGHLPVPGGGPVLVARPVGATAVPPLGQWSLRMGDVELL